MATGWSRQFEDPIPLPRGRQLVTLKDAADYIMKLPKAEQHVKEWQAAIEDAAEKWFEENDPEGLAFEYEVLE
jgi:hypothetical protein